MLLKNVYVNSPDTQIGINAFAYINSMNLYGYKKARDYVRYYDNGNITFKSLCKDNSHKYARVTVPAQLFKDGYTADECTVCGELKNKTAIYAPKSVTVANAIYRYNGKTHKPKVVVRNSKGKVISASNYTIEYINNKNAGTAVVRIKFKGMRYKESINGTFRIVKATNVIKAPTAYTRKASRKAGSFLIHASDRSGKLTYKSNNRKVKVSSKGKVTIAGGFKGKAVITITGESANYRKATKRITVTVK